MGCLFPCCKRNPSIDKKEEKKGKKGKGSKGKKKTKQRIPEAPVLNIVSAREDEELDLQVVHVKKNTEKFKISSEFPLSSLKSSQKNTPDTPYNCPICLNYFNRMLITSCCCNYICRVCAEDYLTTTIKYLSKIKCPICTNEDNIILKDVDLDKPVKSYLDLSIVRDVSPRKTPVAPKHSSKFKPAKLEQ